MRIVATITNDLITPSTMAKIDMRYYSDRIDRYDFTEVEHLLDRRSILTLHEIAQEKIALCEHYLNTIEIIDNRVM